MEGGGRKRGTRDPGLVSRWSVFIVERADMKNTDLQAMSVDELWELHEAVVAELGQKMAAERALLEARLRQLGAVTGNGLPVRTKRPYPKVVPKYRNPKNQNETWAGRGKQPRWLLAQLRRGKKLNDFLIMNERE